MKSKARSIEQLKAEFPGRCIICERKLTPAGSGRSKTHLCGKRDCLRAYNTLYQADARDNTRRRIARLQAELAKLKGERP